MNNTYVLQTMKVVVDVDDLEDESSIVTRITSLCASYSWRSRQISYTATLRLTCRRSVMFIIASTSRRSEMCKDREVRGFATRFRIIGIARNGWQVDILFIVYVRRKQ